MALRFRKRVKIVPGVTVNLSSRGVSTTVGVRGASLNVGKQGTGISYRQKISNFGRTNASIFNPSSRAINQTARNTPMNDIINSITRDTFRNSVPPKELHLFMHLCHLFLSFITVGIWGIAWVIHAWSRHSKVKAYYKNIADFRGRLEGLIMTLESKYGDHEIIKKILNKEIWRGQTKQQLIDSYGDPVSIDEKVEKDKIIEMYKYHQKSKERFGLKVKIEDNIVTGWEKSGS